MSRFFIILNFLLGINVQNLTGDLSDTINAMPNYNSEYEDTDGWYSRQGKMIYDQPQPLSDTPDTNNSLDTVPNNLPGTI